MEESAMPYAAVNGQNLYYEDTGGEKPTVIFSHGLLMDQTMFAPQIAALKSSYRCISWDERAHGRTAGQACEPFSYYDSADDLVALLKHLGVERAVLVGMSQGGYLSLRCGLVHPKIVRAMILIDTQAMPEDPAKMPSYAQMMDVWAKQGLPDSIADTIADIILGAGWADATSWKAKWKQWQPHNLLQAFHTLGSRDDICEKISMIKVPTLVIHGEKDVAISLDRAEAMAASLSNAELVVIAGGGHASNLTHADQVNPHILRFLAALESDAPSGGHATRDMETIQ